MKLYLIRHGESELGALGRHQFPDTKLSAEGIKQAELVADRFQNIPIGLIISSPFKRAHETAEVIGKRINKSVQALEFLREIKRPSVIEGRGESDSDVVVIKNVIKENYDKPGWRHSDEETFFELRDRGRKALDYISGLNEENVLVVTHGIFIKMLLLIMSLGERTTPQEFLALEESLVLGNTGITLCEYKNEKWELITCNDQAHFG